MSEINEPSGEKRVQKVISGEASVRKKSEFKKFTDSFLHRDFNSIKSYIVADVLLPSLRDAIWSIFNNGFKMLLYGESGAPRSGIPASKASYRKYFDNPADARPRDIGIRSRDAYVQRAQAGFAYDDILFESRGDAEDVLERMQELLDIYQIVSVADLYDLAGVKNDNYTGNSYGWTDISLAVPIRVQDGYILKLPKAQQVK